MSRKKFNYKRKLPINRYDLGSFLGITDDKGKITAGAGGIANAFAGMANTLMNPSGNTTGVGNIMSSLGSVASNIPGVGGLIGAGVNLLGGLTNAAFGSNINEAAISNIRSNIANQAATTFDYSSSDNLLGDWSNYRDLDRIKTSDVGSDGWFNNAASNKAKQLNKQALEANLRAMANFANAANSLDILNTQAALVNYNADGGPLAMRYTGLMSPFGSRFSDGGILSDNNYYSIMEKVAKDNYRNWGFNSEEEALVHALNDNTYDYRGFYNKYPKSKANADTHWTDEFKTAYHPTFSTESIYSGKKSKFNPSGLTGGSWDGETFIPADWQNKKAEGGNLFTNGITMIGNGGTHEYLEGQEYDVTEEEVKLLKKLGYEFEYL